MENLYIYSEGHVVRTIQSEATTMQNADEFQQLLTIAEWSPEDKRNYISIFSMEIKQDEKRGAAPAAAESILRLAVDSCVSCLEVATCRNGSHVVLAGSSTGDIYKCELKLLPNEWATAENIQVAGLSTGIGNERLEPWMAGHRNDVGGVDINREKEGVTVGLDGKILVGSLLSGRELHPLKVGSPSVSYTGVKWTSEATFVTCGTSGRLDLWDKRKGNHARPTSSTSPAKATPNLMSCLDVHAARPHICATGSCGGEAAVWDMRMNSGPLLQSRRSRGEGQVAEIHFDRIEEGGQAAAAVPKVLFATLGGPLWRLQAASQEEPEVAQLLGGIPGGLVSFSADASDGRHLYGLSGAEFLVYYHRSIS